MVLSTLHACPAPTTCEHSLPDMLAASVFMLQDIFCPAPVTQLLSAALPLLHTFSEPTPAGQEANARGVTVICRLSASTNTIYSNPGEQSCVIFFTSSNVPACMQAQCTLYVVNPLWTVCVPRSSFTSSPGFSSG